MPTNSPGISKRGAPWVHGLLLCIAVSTLLPFAWMVLASFKPLNEIQSYNPFPCLLYTSPSPRDS